MFPEVINIFGLKISAYGILVALGFLVAYFLSIKLSAKEGIPKEKAESVYLWAAIFGVIGSRIAFILEHPEEIEGFLDIFALWKGGVSFYGGLIGGIVGALIAIWRNNIPVWKASDVAAPSLVIAHTIGRIGCFTAGCCYGKPFPYTENTEVGIHFTKEFPFFYIVFPQGAVAPYGIPLYPTQLMEAFGNFIIFLILLLIFKKKSFDGQVFVSYMFLYGLLRFSLEFYRGVTPPIEGLGLTWNQIVSLVMIFSSVVLFLVLRKVSSTSPVKS